MARPASPRRRPPRSGRLRGPISSAVTIHWDRWGVAHVRAESDRDVFVANFGDISEQEIRKELRITEGRAFDFYKWQGDRDKLEKLFLDRGYYQARITARRDPTAPPPTPGKEPTPVDLGYTIEEGPPTSLVVRGAKIPGSLREALEVLVQLLAPFAPHVTNEIWFEMGRSEELATLHWPEADPQLVVDDAYQIAVQVNGKLRGEVQVAATAAESEIKEVAAKDPKVADWLHGKTIKKVVVIPTRLVNFVV